MTARPDHRWYAKQNQGPVLHDFAVRRFVEIYRTDLLGQAASGLGFGGQRCQIPLSLKDVQR
jgi:hypothetical protein